MTAPRIKRLLVSCPPDLVGKFGSRETDFEVFQGETYLVFRLNRGYYTPVRNYQNNQAGYIRGLGNPISPVRAYEPEIQIKVVDERLCLFDLINAISLRSINTLRRRTPATIIDFLLPEAEDREAAMLAATPYEPYTKRIGKIKEPKASGGMIGLDDDFTKGWIAGGFTFNFVQRGLRYE